MRKIDEPRARMQNFAADTTRRRDGENLCESGNFLTYNFLYIKRNYDY
jgi:hypothetical protein